MKFFEVNAGFMRNQEFFHGVEKNNMVIVKMEIKKKMQNEKPKRIYK